MDERTCLRRPVRSSHPGSVLFRRSAGRHVRLWLSRCRGGISAARPGLQTTAGGYTGADRQHHAGGLRRPGDPDRGASGRDRPQPHEAFRHGGTAATFPLPDPAGLPRLGHRRGQRFKESVADCTGRRRELRAGAVRMFELLGTLRSGHRRRPALHRLRHWTPAGVEARTGGGGGPGARGESIHYGGWPDH